MHPSSHPARFNKKLLPIFASMVGDSVWVFDPLAGTGERLDELNKLLPNAVLLGTEIEYEWASVSPTRVLCIDAFEYLKMNRDNAWDAILTSPTYGNRMADHHNAKDGSKRNTYTHRLGRPLSENNSGKLQWGDEYRDFHYRLWCECVRVLKPCGKFILNVKDHIRDGKVQEVSKWHIETLCAMGMIIQQIEQVVLPSLKNGANSNLRVPFEEVIMFTKGTIDEQSRSFSERIGLHKKS
jgi:hypothetical protein